MRNAEHNTCVLVALMLDKPFDVAKHMKLYCKHCKIAEKICHDIDIIYDATANAEYSMIKDPMNKNKV